MTNQQSERSAKVARALSLRASAEEAVQESKDVDLSDTAAVARVLGKMEALLLTLGIEVCMLVEASRPGPEDRHAEG